ncbi:MAG: enoyl-CoA hydratase/isomerase family protein, partial [Paracoccaceae bacterium]
THDMCLAIEAAIDDWSHDDDVALVVIDAAGDRAFCAGGDIVQMYRTAAAGDYGYGRTYWADEYRMNAKVFNFPKPYVAFMQGFTMGGGVGISCHGSHRIVCESTQISMPECSIGLVPDVGGTLLLARAPGRIGEYLGTTATRMGPGDAMHAEFADYFIPQDQWPDLIRVLEDTGDPGVVDAAARPLTDSPLHQNQPHIDVHFGGETIGDIVRSMQYAPDDFTESAMKVLRRHSPLSLACTIEMIHRVRGTQNIERALQQEYRFTYRAAEHGDFVEGIRAAIIDKDRAPKWRHGRMEDVDSMEVAKMLMPLGARALEF